MEISSEFKFKSMIIFMLIAMGEMLTMANQLFYVTSIMFNQNYLGINIILSIIFLLFTLLMTAQYAFDEKKIPYLTFIKSHYLTFLISFSIITAIQYCNFLNYEQLKNEIHATHDIVDPIIKEAVTTNDPLQYVQIKLQESLQKQNIDPSKWKIEVTYPEGYQYQKPLKIAISRPFHPPYILTMIPSPGKEISSIFTEPLSSPYVLKATLEKAQ
jgi:hypothetical protein